MKVEMGMHEGERRQTNFLSLYKLLGSIVATQGWRCKIGQLLWFFFNFFQIFPNLGK